MTSLIGDLQNTIFEIIGPQGSVVLLNHVADLIILKFVAELSSNMIPRWVGGDCLDNIIDHKL